VTGLRTLVGLALAVAALAGCGDSPEDEARDDGKQVGEATRAVADSTSVEQAQEAVADLRTAVGGLDPDTRDRVRSQVETQGDQLRKGVETARSAGSFDEAHSELQSTAQELRSQADAFRSSNDSIANEFWRGFEEGYDGD
jgi:hypothetical protein